MKTLTIKPDEFKAEFYQTPDKNSDFKRDPHPYGFYHYPDNIQDKTALGRLKKVMIADRERRIEALKTEIKTIKGLKYEEATD